MVWVDSAGVVSPSRTQARYLWAIETELAKRGLEIPFPQRDINFRKGRIEVALVSDNGAPVPIPPVT